MIDVLLFFSEFRIYQLENHFFEKLTRYFLPVPSTSGTNKKEKLISESKKNLRKMIVP